MYGRNPKTGAPIRIIRSDASLWRDQKTLVWDQKGRGQQSQQSQKTQWDTGVTSSADASGATIVICLGPLDQEESFLRSPTVKDHVLIALPKSLIDNITIAELATLRLPNLICLEEVQDLYPFIGPRWDGTVDDAKAIISLILRFSRSGPILPSSSRAAVAASLGTTFLEEVPPSPPLWFITQYYIPDKPKRALEIKKCLQKNIECVNIDKIVLLNERSYLTQEPLLSDPKVQEEIVGKRLTYATVIQWIYEKAPADAIIVFANADIYLDQSFSLLWSVSLEDRCLTLLRWDKTGNQEPVLFGPREDSQDTWILSAASVKRRTWDYSTLNFPFGQGGCDNAFAIEIFKQKFLVVNPALTLKTIHLHESGVRTYNPRDIVDRPAYLFIQPTGLHDLRPVYTVPKDVIAEKLALTSVDRPIKGPLSSSQAKTFATMATRVLAGKDVFDAEGPNTWSSLPVELESRKNIFQTRNGLAFTTNSILVGPTKAGREIWAKVELSTMSASVLVKKAVIAPLSAEIIASPTRYVLEYLSKILLLRERIPDGEFWASKKPEVFETLQLFRWNSTELPVLAYQDTSQAWCEEALVWPIVEPSQNLIAPEQIAVLRGALKMDWLERLPESEAKRIVIVNDGVWITDEDIEALEKACLNTEFDVIWKSTTLDILTKKLIGASGLIACSTNISNWAWLLPRKAPVWDIQCEMTPSADLLHLCGAAGLDHRLIVTPKAPTPSATQRQDVMVKIIQNILAPPPSEIPIVVLPAKRDNFFDHAGDSFREMVRMWDKEGYVKVEESEVATQVWLGGIGDTLLYDRPTLDWIRAAPPAELKWKRALFGNPPPLAGTKSWTFWPRRPSIVESLVDEGAAAAKDRSKRLVFYGRSENATQKAMRSKFDWSTACDDFVHVQGSDPYPFTQEEYLRKLTESRFGLCLAGYGKKCHREIECMAMGTVPILAPEVDITTYAEPPVEGTHFFRAESPEDARLIAKETKESTWLKMSLAVQDWWRRNASVKGSWELTKRLAGL